MKKLFRKEVIIGFCVILALVILFFGIEYLKGLNVFKPSNYYYVVYSDAAGLEPAAPVTVNGFKVGQVKTVEYMYDNPGHVLVELSLDKELKLPHNTTADIDVSLLGTSSIKLSMGTSQNYYAIGDTIKGDVIAGMLDAVQKDVLPNVNGIANKADSLLISLNRLAANTAIPQTLRNLEQFTVSLNTTMNGVQPIVKGASTAMNGVNNTINQLPGVVNDVNEITARILAIADDLHTMSTSLANTLAEAPIEATLQNLNQMSEQLVELSKSLNNPDSSVGKLLNDPALYNQLNQTISDLDSLFVDIKKNPKRYINIKLL